MSRRHSAPHPRTLSAFAALSLTIAAAACGGSAPPPAPSTPAATTVSPTPCPTIAPGPVELCGVVNNTGEADVTDQGSSVELEIETPPGFTFTPTFIKASPGAEVTVTLVNTQEEDELGSLHTFTISSLDLSQTIRPGETQTITFTLPADEPFLPFFCAIGSGGHRTAGMQGAFYFG
jgi:plastocyanin